jgi:NAD-dependent deacetylase
MLAEWEKRVEDFVVVTQNIDGLHHAAGSERVVELHGRLDMARCTQCAYRVQGLDDLGADPRCPDCAARLRPDVVWFGEMLPPGAIEAAFEAAQRCDVLLLIGTSGVVQPAASLAEIAKSYGARIIEINPNRTPLSSLADVCIAEGCRDALVAIDGQWRRLGS